MRTVKKPIQPVKKNFIVRFFLGYKSVWREFQWFIFYVRSVSYASHTYEFKSRFLRLDWIFRMYTVVNLTLDEATWPVEEQKMKLLEKLSDIHDYFKTLDVHDIIELVDKPIQPESAKILLKDTQEIIDAPITSYLVYYQFMYEYLNWTFIIKHLIIIVALIYWWSPIVNFCSFIVTKLMFLL